MSITTPSPDQHLYPNICETVQYQIKSPLPMFKGGLSWKICILKIGSYFLYQYAFFKGYQINFKIMIIPTSWGLSSLWNNYLPITGYDKTVGCLHRQRKQSHVWKWIQRQISLATAIMMNLLMNIFLWAKICSHLSLNPFSQLLKYKLKEELAGTRSTSQDLMHSQLTRWHLWSKADKFAAPTK